MGEAEVAATGGRGGSVGDIGRAGCTPFGVSWMETVETVGTVCVLALLDEVFFDLGFAFLDDDGGWFGWLRWPDSFRTKSMTRGRWARSIASWMFTSSLFK